MKFCFLHFFYAWLFLSISSCGSNSTDKTEKLPPPEIPNFDLHSKWVDSVYNSLSLEEKVAQLIWAETQLSDSLSVLFKELPLGALIIDETKKNYFKFRSLCDSLPSPVLLGTPNWYWPLTFENNKWNHDQFLSVNDPLYLSSLYDSTLTYLNDLGIHFVFQNIDSTHVTNSEKSPLYNLRLDSVKKHMEKHNIVPSYQYDVDSFPAQHSSDAPILFDFDNKINENAVPKTTLLIKGATFSQIKDETDSIISLLTKGNDIVLIENLSVQELIGIQHAIHHAIDLKLINEESIEFNLRKVLALKELLFFQKSTSFNPIEFEKKHIVSLRSFQYEMKYNSQILLRNKNNLLPIKDWDNQNFKWVHIGKDKLKFITPAIINYADISASNATVNNLALDKYKNSKPLIIILNEELDSTSATLLQDKINLYSSTSSIILVNVKHANNLRLIDNLPCLLHVWDDDEHSQKLIAQAIFGGVPITGKLAYSIGIFTPEKSLKTIKTRLAYSIPEAGGFHRDSLKNVDNVAKETIYTKVSPGCQILAIRHGNVIYNKTFGYHTYERNLIVNKQDAYDIASVTKVAATTLCGMKMYEQGLYNLSDSLRDHLPDSLIKVLHHKSRLSDITFNELFTHTSGLPSGLPIYKFIAYVDSIIGKFDRYYCDETNSDYCVEVARNFYLDSAYLDSLWIDLNRIWPGEKKYKYSDANMNVLYQIFRSKIVQSYHEYMADSFYRPLKLRSTTFLPLEYLDTIKHPIAPTEFDTYWRYQLLKGSVHDPNAALYGGVAGNAGLFSNANELGVLFQMLMNGGSYGGKQYLQPQTVKKFTTHQVGSHRGLGFDKPTGQSVSTVAPDCPTTAFGHTGFTGICVWADPENDLIFVFVSNRVHPDPNNKNIITYGTRKRLHQAFYNQLKYSNQYRNKLRAGKQKEPEA